DVKIVKLLPVIFANQMVEDCEQVAPVLVHLRPLRAMAAVLDLKLVQVEASREFIQIGRIRVWHIEPVERGQELLGRIHECSATCFSMLSDLDHSPYHSPPDNWVLAPAYNSYAVILRIAALNHRKLLSRSTVCLEQPSARSTPSTLFLGLSILEFARGGLNQHQACETKCEFALSEEN